MTENLQSKSESGVFVSVLRPLMTCVGAAIIAAGCSADVTRFSGPAFSLNSDDKASLLPPEGLGGSGSSRLSEQTPDTGYGGGAATANIQTSALSEATQSYDSYQPRRRTADAAPSYNSPTRASYGTGTSGRLEKGQQITVERGDTLYGLSRRHGVSVAELMTVNRLDSSMLRIGQTLYLPAGTTASYVPSQASRSRNVPSRSVASGPVDVPATWNGRYEVQSGDSLYKIARQYGVKSFDLQRYNAITDPRRVRPGTVLRVPGGTGAPTSPSNVNSGQRYAALTDGSTSDAAPATRGVRTVTIRPSNEKPPVNLRPVTESSERKLLWPVRGKVIAGFGARADGTHNDGVNFSVPPGTDVFASDDGVVAYAGSELRSYGNLILVRHDNGWVTAYAHNDKLLVGRGDKVKRGQVIAKSGSSGQVDQPQVHFELRQSSKKPVDPIPYLEKL